MPAPRIDAHQHFWTLRRGDYGWLSPELGPLYRDFGPADYLPHLVEARLDRSILVQAAPTAEETDFLLEIADKTPFVAGVVGWLDFAGPEPGATLEGLRARGLVGVRPMIQDERDPDWMLRPAHAPAFEAIAELGLVFDALVRPVHLPRLRQLQERHPELSIVIDHAAKPAVAAGEQSPWDSDLRDLATHPGTCCKLSGLANEAGDGWNVDTLRPYAEHVLGCFGAERVLWGSDWPVVELAGGFDAWWRVTGELLAELSPSEGAALLGGSAARTYGVGGSSA